MTETKSDFSEYLDVLPERPTIIETLVQQILSLITEAGLQPGDRLPSEKEIIAATTASRPSVREALRALKTMGIIETRPGAGSFVTHLEPASLIRPEVISLILRSEDLKEIVGARKVLECEVARLAARRPPDELAQLEAILDDMRSRAESGQGLYESTWAFHMGVAKIAGNQVMAKLMRILYEMISEIELELYWPNIDFREEAENHEKLYKAILKGEKEAELAVRDHLDRVANIVGQALESRGKPGEPSQD